MRRFVVRFRAYAVFLSLNAADRGLYQPLVMDAASA
jgi:hypothetical protein